MRFSSSSPVPGPRTGITAAAARFLSSVLALTSSAALPRLAGAISFQSAPATDLDLSHLGRVALTGSFDAVSLFQYIGQSETPASNNGSQSLYSRYPTGQFAALDTSDASIMDMCPFMATNGTLNAIAIVGNFTGLGGLQSPAVALFDPTSGGITALAGLDGQATTVYCDTTAQALYIGGTFVGLNSTNAIIWMNEWVNLPFAGFNGPVNSITALSNGNVVFGGQFTAIGNLSTGNSLPVTPQVVSFGSANVTATGESSNPEYSNPATIICATPGETSNVSSFLLQPDEPGSFTATFGFGFVPSILRLLNTQVSGYGTKTWRYTALPLDGILNFTYYDATGVLQSCTNECPMAQNDSYQEFYFVNPIGQNSFRIDISDWYGQGGGFSGVEILQDAIEAYAIDNFNSPTCDGIATTNASATVTGPWTIAPSGESYSDYLTITLPDGTGNTTNTSVVFMPKIQVSGNYSVNMWTPGCVQDNTCASRGQVNITGVVASSTSSASSTTFSTTLYQTNNYLKYDQIYYGYIEAETDSYQPAITLTPFIDQNGPLTVVAQSLSINLTMAASSTPADDGGGVIGGLSGGGDNLNGLFEFNPDLVDVTTNTSTSTIDYAGTLLEANAKVMTMLTVGDALYVGGSFASTSGSLENIMVIEDGNATDLGFGGLNAAVQAIYYVNDTLYIGGSFTGTLDNGSVTGLNGAAAYSTVSKSWAALGAGVNGMVYDVVPISINVSSVLQAGIAFSGYFTEINAFNNTSSASASDIAIWIPALNNWLQNLDAETISISGRLSSWSDVPGTDPLYAGSISSQALVASGAIGLNDNALGVQQYPLTFNTSSSSMDANSGVLTGLFYTSNGMNLTILGGNFTAIATNGSQISNLAIINGTNNNQVTGLPYNSSADASVLALASSNTTLFAGGSFSGGLLFYDLSLSQLSSVQPPSVTGALATVSAIALQPSSSLLYVGGSFQEAGSLSCPGLCIYDTSMEQWQPGPAALTGDTTISYLDWSSSDRLVIAGNLTISGASTTMATFDPQTSTLTPVSNANTLPGPITAYAATSDAYTSAFVAGVATSNSSSYLSYFDGTSTWTTISGLGERSNVSSLLMLELSSSHASTASVSPSQSLLVMGQLNLTGYGDVSAAVFNGTTFVPLLLSTMSDGSPGTIYGAIVEDPQDLFTSGEGHLALGFVVLIALACALGVVFLIVVAGILIERIRRRREGYVPAPTGALMYEKTGGNIGDVSPHRLFGGVGGKPGGPRL